MPTLIAPSRKLSAQRQYCSAQNNRRVVLNYFTTVIIHDENYSMDDLLFFDLIHNNVHFIQAHSKTYTILIALPY